MTEKFKELMKGVCFTKAELLKKIESLPDDVVFETSSADIGGYDVSFQPYVALSISVDKKTGKTVCSFGHLEYEAYEARYKGEITEEECQVLYPD